MALVPAKCTQCGGNLEVDDTKDASICTYCGTPFITEKAIHNYNTNITNNIVNNNNFTGANVTIQDDNNIDGLLLLAKRELQAEHYGSKDLERYLEDIIIKSPENTDRIIELFHDVGLYEMAESAVKQKKEINEHWEIIHLLTKYDPDNIIGWLWEWETSFSVKFVSTGKNIIRLAADPEKAEYEKEVYSYFADHGPRCNAYKEYLTAIPPDYIRENKFIQDILVTHINRLMNSNENKRIEYIKSLLPSERLADIVTPIPTYTQSKGGCYIATCVYGSYNCPQVWTLRRFRDYTLSTTWYGRVFINVITQSAPHW